MFVGVRRQRNAAGLAEEGQNEGCRRKDDLEETFAEEHDGVRAGGAVFAQGKTARYQFRAFVVRSSLSSFNYREMTSERFTNNKSFAGTLLRRSRESSP